MGHQERPPLEILGEWLSVHHRGLTVNDVALSRVTGYLYILTPCRGERCVGGFMGERHYHTLYIARAGYYKRPGRSPYRLWRDLHGLLPQPADDEELEHLRKERLAKDQLALRRSLLDAAQKVAELSEGEVAEGGPEWARAVRALATASQAAVVDL